MEAPPVQYVTTPDGFRIAYCVTGKGMPCVIVPVGFHHIKLMSKVDAYRPWIAGLAERFMLVQYDGRGQGLSTRNLAAFSQDDRLVDLEAVVDHLKLEPAVLFANGSSGHIAVRLAAKHPNRVRALVLMACSVTTEPWPSALLDTLANKDWDVFLDTLAGGGKSFEEGVATRELLKQMVTQADFALMFSTWQGSRIEEVLPHVNAPALVIHLQQVLRPSLQESAELAARFANARLVEIPGVRMTPWAVADFDAAIGIIESFLADLPKPMPPAPPGTLPNPLSLREIEVLRLIAAGKTNQQIAEALVISLNTVARHVSHIFEKTGVANRTEAANYAHHQGLT